MKLTTTENCITVFHLQVEAVKEKNLKIEDIQLFCKEMSRMVLFKLV